MLAQLERFKGYLVALGAALALALGAYLRGRSAGKGAERQRRAAEVNEQAAQARKEARDVQLETARMGDDAVAAELERDWVRGPGTGRR
ncbi:hypothetical protein [Achromobacter arsenitoxydans]|uniref:Uncharacterized protein n=1 Tax=Achromobacter arsenitoxydans SY8 TaxID=477184 RepID=H0FAD8_9BURK|nr:hypothetical protein [Achromobacter arsenitoxydans]EHK64769.1 hypothetical protein KYC_18200 [Achromobacter arsenitoxydans SY8]